jgi:hypothetical protein
MRELVDELNEHDDSEDEEEEFEDAKFIDF